MHAYGAGLAGVRRRALRAVRSKRQCAGKYNSSSSSSNHIINVNNDSRDTYYRVGICLGLHLNLRENTPLLILLGKSHDAQRGGGWGKESELKLKAN